MSDGPRREDVLPAAIICICLVASCLLGWSALERVDAFSPSAPTWAVQAGMN